MQNTDWNDKHEDPIGSVSLADAEDAKPSDYMKAVKATLRNSKKKDAFVLLQKAAVRFPEEPLILSYYGCFQAVVDKKYRSGVETCKKAIALLKKKGVFGEELLYPIFYLNLGRAYLSAGKKPDAIDAYKRGLKYDSGNSELLRELRILGIRKAPPVAFLNRSNPINKYIGLILRSVAKNPGKTTKRRLSR